MRSKLRYRVAVVTLVLTVVMIVCGMLSCERPACEQQSDCVQSERCFHGYCIAANEPPAAQTTQQQQRGTEPIRESPQSEINRPTPPLPAPPACEVPAPGDFVINEILASPKKGQDTNRDGVPSTYEDEFVELLNLSSKPVQIGGLALRINNRVKHYFTSQCLPPGHAIVVFSGGDLRRLQLKNGIAVLASGKSSIANSGGVARLITEDNQVLEQFLFLETKPGVSSTRFPDGTGGVMLHTAVPKAGEHLISPGQCVDGSDFPECPALEREPAAE